MGFGISYLNRSQNFSYYLNGIIDEYKQAGYDCSKDELFLMGKKYKAVKSFQKGLHNYFLVAPNSSDRSNSQNNNKFNIDKELPLSNNFYYNYGDDYQNIEKLKIVQIYHLKYNDKSLNDFIKHVNILKNIPKKTFIRSIHDFHIEDTKRSLKIFISQDYSSFISLRDFLENIYEDFIKSKIEVNLVKIYLFIFRTFYI
jgi:hypothetical protein